MNLKPQRREQFRPAPIPSQKEIAAMCEKIRCENALRNTRDRGGEAKPVEIKIIQDPLDRYRLQPKELLDPDG
jgi:hypothetical protein